MDHAHPNDVQALLWFAGWLVALGALFAISLALPLQTRLSAFRARLYGAGVVVAIVGVAILANVAVSLHDMYVDLTREKVFTPSAAALEVVDRLQQPVRLSYYFQGEDQAGRRAADIVQVMGRRNPLLDVRVIDPDKEPNLARNAGIKLYNAAVLKARGRRIIVNSVDETEIAIGIQRVLRERVVTACFLEGHQEYPMDAFEFHTHLEGGAGHSHDDSSSAIIQTTGHGVGRLRRVLEGLGYDVREIVPAVDGSIAASCTLVINAGPRTTYLPNEARALEAYLSAGGALMLLFDLGFELEPGLQTLLRKLGLEFPQAILTDPKSNYGKDAETVAVTAYDPHPITRRVSLTFFPGVRPITLTTPQSGVRTAALVTSSDQSVLAPVAPVRQRSVEDTPSATRQQGQSHEPEREHAHSHGQGQPHDHEHTTGTHAHNHAVQHGHDSEQDHGHEHDSNLDMLPKSRVIAAVSEGTLREESERPFRVVAVGDADFVSNSFLPYMANSDLALAMVRWLAREERSTAILSRIPVPKLVLLTDEQSRNVFLLTVVLLPGVVAVLGIAMWWRGR